MPFVDKETQAKIQLYNRCKAWNCLPSEGGIFKQEETLMIDFDAISRTIARHQERLRQEQESKMKVSKTGR